MLAEVSHLILANSSETFDRAIRDHQVDLHASWLAFYFPQQWRYGLCPQSPICSFLLAFFEVG